MESENFQSIHCTNHSDVIVPEDRIVVLILQMPLFGSLILFNLDKNVSSHIFSFLLFGREGF